MDIYLHLPRLRFIWSQGIVQRQQCYDLTCEDAPEVSKEVGMRGTGEKKKINPVCFLQRRPYAEP